ncbi:MAG: hypothetical protein AAAC47_14595 [Pararhizobium sp.]
MPALRTVLFVVNAASREIGISQRDTSQALGSNDEDVVQMASLLNVVADELLLEEPYQDVLGDGMWLLGDDGVYRGTPQEDTDIILFDGRLAINGLKYRFLQAKGLEFGEQMRDFLTRMAKIATRANNRVLDLNADESRAV